LLRIVCTIEASSMEPRAALLRRLCTRALLPRQGAANPLRPSRTGGFVV
jgi:hypothetical protein